MTTLLDRIAQTLARDIAATPEQVRAAVDLLDGGATVPFIARYRKEATGGLDDTQLRTLSTRLDALRGLEDRRAAILKSLKASKALTPALHKAIEAADTRTALEDLYAPYKPKRASKAKTAREQGLQPLADLVRTHADPLAAAQAFATQQGTDPQAALAGARDILIEEVSEEAGLLAALRSETAQHGALVVRVPRGADAQAAQPWADAIAQPQKIATLPAHRLLGLLRAAKSGALAIEAAPTDPTLPQQAVERALLGARALRGRAPAWMAETAETAWKTRIRGAVSTAVLAEARERAQEAAVAVFAQNLKALLLAPPAGQHNTMGIDPGVRTGIKIAVVDATGKLLATQTLYPFAPKHDMAGTKIALASLIRRHQVALIAIGNGTGGRETQDVVRDTLASMAKMGKGALPKAFLTSEAGASVYSASEAAARELPHLDVSLRGAVSIARRAQDPLAELIKIEPRALGIGQYQHDIDPQALDSALAGVVEDAVGAVGVDLNTASAALLAHVPGVGPALAAAIVAHRDAHGPFATRKALLDVPRLGPKAFEQCAGFLRIRGGSEPLDATGIHPESYPLARAIIKAAKGKTHTVIGKPEALSGVKAADFVKKGVGLPTIQGVLEELARPRRDPRAAFTVAEFDAGVRDIGDVKVGMRLEGTVTNVASFGAFVDIGVHQDGLVHISQMANERVADPHTKARIGQTVSVEVLAVDVAKKRISLSMRTPTR